MTLHPPPLPPTGNSLPDVLDPVWTKLQVFWDQLKHMSTVTVTFVRAKFVPAKLVHISYYQLSLKQFGQTLKVGFWGNLYLMPFV